MSQSSSSGSSLPSESSSSRTASGDSLLEESLCAQPASQVSMNDGSNPSEFRWPDRFLRAVKAAMIGTDMLGRVTYWNPFAEEIYGWRPEEVLGRNIMEITVSPETEEAANRRMGQVLSEGSSTGEFQVTCKDGSLLNVLVTLSLVRDEAGAPVGIIGISQDMRTLKEVQGALRESEEHFQAFADSLPELCWIARSDGHIYWYNERWYEYTGTSPEEMKGWGWQKVHDANMLPSVMERWKDSLEHGQSFEMEFPLRGADGIYRWFLTRVKPLRDAQGKVTRWYGTNTNVDEQRNLLESLSEARDELEKKVLERTAELRAATESLRELSARLLRMRDDEQRRLARELHDSVGQLLAAISMNIAVVEAESSKLSPAAARCVADNAKLVDEVSREIRTISHLLHPPLLDETGLASALRWYSEEFAKRSRIEVRIEIPEGMERLPHDSEITIFRVVQECLTNIHRHAESATASIQIRKDKSEIVVEVQDWGRGVPQDKLRNLSQMGRVGVGFGGMRERLRQLGGRLEVESDSGGTRVRAVLPLAPPA